MKKNLTRRDFIKLATALPLGLSTQNFSKTLERLSPAKKAENVIIVVFDAFSANNIPIYGYERNTTPNITRLSKQAIVYHNHYSGSNFTTSGTASLLTGTLPWTNRAIELGGKIADSLINQNIFSIFEEYYRITYTHNIWANIFLKQFQEFIEEPIPPTQLYLSSYDAAIHEIFKNDEDLAAVSWARNMKLKEYKTAYSLFLSRLYDSLTQYQLKNLEASFPLGFPTSTSDVGFVLEQAVDYIIRRLTSISRPFFGYFHFLPPHKPYRTTREFYNAFNSDRYKPLIKPVDEMFTKQPEKDPLRERRYYDEFILYCDREFGRLYNALEESDTLENTWLILTSDHGEMNERGISGHITDLLYQPNIRIPLMIFEPGRKKGIDIYENTSAVDLLPTLAHLTGRNSPHWAEGNIMPPFAELSNRNLYIVRATENKKYAPLTTASTALVRENYKLHYYFGYRNLSNDRLLKLFDIKRDPEELNDLSATKKEVAQELINELKGKLMEVDKPYLPAS